MGKKLQRDKDLSDLFATVKRRIDEEAEEAGFVGHAGETGAEREEILKKFLISLLPKFFRYGGGKLINHMNQKTSQQDIIIYSPYVSILTETSKLFPIDSSFSTIEVKSHLNGDELEKAMKNIATVKRMKKTLEDGRKMQCNIFAYSADSNSAILKNINILRQKLKLSDEDMFDNLCIHGRSLITKNNKLKAMSSSSNKFDYLCMNLGDRTIPYFLDSMISTIEIPKKMLPIFINYLGVFDIGVEEWKLE